MKAVAQALVEFFKPDDSPPSCGQPLLMKSTEKQSLPTDQGRPIQDTPISLMGCILDRVLPFR